MYCADMLGFSSFSGAATAATRRAARRRCSARGRTVATGGVAAAGGGGWGRQSHGALPGCHWQLLGRPATGGGQGGKPRTTMQSQFPTPSSHLLLAGGRGLRQAGRLLLPGGPTGLHRRGGRHGASARLLLHWCCLLVSLSAACLCGSLQQPQQPIGQGRKRRLVAPHEAQGPAVLHAAAAGAARVGQPGLPALSVPPSSLPLAFPLPDKP